MSSSTTLCTSAPGVSCLSTLVIRRIVFRSARSASSAPGYWILTATSRPSDHTPLCTWPMLAEATGVSSNEANRARHLVPSCPSSIRCTFSADIGGASFCSLVSASR